MVAVFGYIIVYKVALLYVTLNLCSLMAKILYCQIEPLWSCVIHELHYYLVSDGVNTIIAYHNIVMKILHGI